MYGKSILKMLYSLLLLWILSNSFQSVLGLYQTLYIIHNYSEKKDKSSYIVHLILLGHV